MPEENAGEQPDEKTRGMQGMQTTKVQTTIRATKQKESIRWRQTLDDQYQTEVNLEAPSWNAGKC